MCGCLKSRSLMRCLANKKGLKEEFDHNDAYETSSMPVKNDKSNMQIDVR